LGGLFGFFRLLFRRPRVLLYFVIIVIGIGGTGIWIPLWQLHSGGTTTAMDVYRNYATWVIAIAITSFAEFLLRKRERDERTVTLFLLGLAIVGTVPAIALLISQSVTVAKYCTWVSAAAALWLWFIALADSPSFEEEDARTAIGGAL
jgi:hypothetical protein